MAKINESGIDERLSQLYEEVSLRMTKDQCFSVKQIAIEYAKVVLLQFNINIDTEINKDDVYIDNRDPYTIHR